jgi:hypothetical protein
MLSWGNRITAVNNIHAKFRKTLVMNDGSPWLRLNQKYLQRRGFLQNRSLISLKVPGVGFILGPGRRIFRPTVPEFDTRLMGPRIGYQAFAVANLEHRSREIALPQGAISFTSPPEDGFAVANLGHRPRNRRIKTTSAESAIQCLNPKRTAGRNQARACAAARGIPPRMCECDGVPASCLPH